MALSVVAVVALAVRIAAALALDGFLHPDVQEYDLIARNLLAGRGFTYPNLGIVYHSYAAPLPVWVSATSYWLTGSLAAAMLLQMITGSTLAVVTAIVAGRLYGGCVAPLAAGLLVAVHPGLVLYSSAKMHALAFDSLFFIAALLQSFRVAERVTIGRAIGLGVIIGVGALSRGTILVLLPISAVWLLIVVPRPTRRLALTCAVIAGASAAAVIAPWTIRNSLIHHRFVPVLTTDSFVFWLGNNPYASGGAYIDAEHTVLGALPAHEREDLESQPDEIAQSEWFKTRAIGFIKAYPGAFVRRALKKFMMFWWFSDQTGLLYPRAWLALYKAYYVAVLLLAAIGVWQLTHASDLRAAIVRGSLLAAFVLGISSLQSLYYVEGRHRWAIEPMILALSGGGVAVILNRRRVMARDG